MRKNKLFGYFIMFLGLGLLAYSFTSFGLSTFLQDSKMEKFEEEFKTRSASFEKELQKYNQGVNVIENGLVDPFNYNEADKKYHINDNSTLNRNALKTEDGQEFDVDNDVFGYLEVPAINLKRPIYLGATYEHLDLGVAHVDNTDLPIGGNSTRAVIAGHRGWVGDVMFYDLNHLSKGDSIFIHQGGKVLAYIVKELLVIDPSDWDSLQSVEGKDMLTLLTCDPQFPPFNQRLIVNAYRLDKKDSDSSKKEKKDSPILASQLDDSDFYEVEKLNTKFTFINKISIVFAVMVWFFIAFNIYKFIKEIGKYN